MNKRAGKERFEKVILKVTFPWIENKLQGRQTIYF